MKNFLLHLFFTVLSTTATFSQAVAWELSAEPGDQASSNANFLSSGYVNCVLTRGAGVTAATRAGSMNASGWFSGIAATTLADAIANNDYYEFTCNSNNCLFFNLGTIKVVLRSSATGPNQATLRCSSDGFATDLGTATVGTTATVFNFSDDISPNAPSVTYRLYGYGDAAGGGLPSSGGTMRIGTSVVSADNDIALFGSTTFLNVAQVANITVNSGDLVPSTVFTANVPGATVNWSRTSEVIGLSASSGTVLVPPFTASNNTGMPVTSTFTVNATVGSCTSPDMIFTITVNPPPCTITVDFSGNPSACNDNGTPNDPSDDFFTDNIQAVFFNRPFTGNLQIVPGGDQIGVYSIPTNQIIGNSFIFNGVKLKADGTPSNIQMNFTDNVTCIDAAVGPTVQPCSSPPVLSCPAPVSVSCSNEVPPVNPASVSETHTCPGNVTITHLSDVKSNQFCLNRLTITRTYQVMDQCGHTVTCAQTIVVNDQTAPTVTCPSNLTVSCGSQVPAIDASVLGVTDNCAGVIGISQAFVSESTTGQTCTNRFTLTRTYRGGDACGNTATCTQTITVNGQTSPTMVCPASLTVSCANQVPAANPASVTDLSDNCGGTTPTVTFVNDATSNQTCANRFTITRTYRATDVCSNTGTCTQVIAVNDQTAPNLTCPSGQTVSCAEQLPAPNTSLVTGLSDNCGGATPTVTFVNDAVSNQTCVNRFTVTRAYRATDACGNSATCAQTIIVNDQTPPIFTAVPASTTVDCYLVPPVGTPTASDNCTSGATVAFLGEVKTPGICPVFYILTRTWRATDACGNSVTASQVVTVTDSNAPQFIVLPVNKVVECGPNNVQEFKTFLDTKGGAIAQDCAQITYSHTDSPIQNNAYTCGNTFRKNIRFIATDECGNSSFRDASFTIVDETPPVFSTPPQSVNLECDETSDNGEAAFYHWVDTNADLVVEDACGSVTLEKILINESKGCGNTWKKTYEFRAKDECGNIAKKTATFAVVDNTPPTLVCLPNDNVYLPCLEDVPVADPSALDAWDCSGVTMTLKETWTNGSGCPNWPMTVAYRYAVKDACGNEALCERAFYVKETSTPSLVCPDTIKVVCVDDIPGPLQLFGHIKSLLNGNCAGGFTSITIVADSGVPQNGAKHRTYTITAKNHCGLVSSACAVTFQATGACKQLCTASQDSWGDPNGQIAGMNTTDAINQLVQSYGPITVGGGGHTVSAPDAACVQELLFGNGAATFLPTGHFTCPLPAALSNADGSLNNQLAANAMALQLNIWFNLKFNNRDLGIQDIQNLPPCLVEFPLLKDLGQHSSVQDLLDLTNQYLQNYGPYYSPDLPGYLNAALDNLNFFRENCGLNAPCERPSIRTHGDPEDAGVKTALRLFPNPASETVNLEFWSPEESSVVLKITDAQGVVYTRSIPATKGMNTSVISIKSLPPGIYSLSLQGSEGVETVRVVKVGNE